MEAIEFGGHGFELCSDAALYWPSEAMLILTDLHLEKGSSFAAKGTFLPPQDTQDTLARLFALCERYDPRAVMLLGDCVHDEEGLERMLPQDRESFERFAKARNVIWVEGNHDQGVLWEGVERVDEREIRGIRFVHQATNRPGHEVSGHYHPCVRLRFRGEGIRKPCFVMSEHRLILPAFGAFTGGLDLCHLEAEVALPEDYAAFVFGNGRVVRVDRSLQRG
jgi:DNA ligase-associated metallophosphoesterase